MRFLTAVLILLPLALFPWAHRNRWAHVAQGHEWAVATAHPMASRVAASILQQNGSAADAVIAAAFVLAVVFPEAGNLGGGFLAVGAQADGERWMLDARETAPLSVTPGTFLSLPKGASLKGPYAAGVPGTVAGLAELHARHGRLPWERLVEPAIALAEDGFALSPREARQLLAHRTWLQVDPGTRHQYYAHEPMTGTVVQLPNLAATLRRIASDPWDFYRGHIAQLILEDARLYGSPMTAADLYGYRAIWRQPVTCRYRGFEIVSAAPPSSGGVILCETAQILSTFLLFPLPPTAAITTHLMVESWRQAYADRERLGDPARLPDGLVEALIAPARGQRLGILIRLDAPGLVTGPPPAMFEGTQTTHLSVVDADGNAVALTTTLNGPFGNGHVVQRAGFLLNNEMDDFNTRPGEANLYGLVQGRANLPAAGMRMLSSMSPTLVFHGDKLVLVIGTPGGSTIPTTVWQILSRLIDHLWTIDRAVAWPRFHFQGTPDRIFYEPGALPPEELSRLEGMGHRLQMRQNPSGDVQAIAWNTRTQRWNAVSDPRGEGLAVAGQRHWWNH